VSVTPCRHAAFCVVPPGSPPIFNEGTVGPGRRRTHLPACHAQLPRRMRARSQGTHDQYHRFLAPILLPWPKPGACFSRQATTLSVHDPSAYAACVRHLWVISTDSMAVGLRRCFGLVAEIGKLAGPGLAKGKLKMGTAKLGNSCVCPSAKSCSITPLSSNLRPKKSLCGKAAEAFGHFYNVHAIDL
jgi:hypothetical protein